MRTLLLCLLFASCAAQPAPRHCPILHKPADASVPTRVLDGEVVGFCCTGCLGKWDRMTPTERRAL
jgi:hypothetical protein